MFLGYTQYYQYYQEQLEYYVLGHPVLSGATRILCFEIHPVLSGATRILCFEIHPVLSGSARNKILMFPEENKKLVRT